MNLKNIFFFILVFFGIYINTYANIVFSEIFPNTIDDTNLEYIKLYNSGDDSVNLSGYIFKDKSGKEFVFSSDDFIDSGMSKFFLRTYTKIILNNTDEELVLLDNSGNTIGTYSYGDTTKGKIIYIVDNEETIEEETNTGNTVIDTEIITEEETNTGSTVIDTEITTEEETNVGNTVVDNEVITEEETNMGNIIVDNEIITEEEINMGNTVVDNEVIIEEETNTGNTIVDNEINIEEETNMGNIVVDNEIIIEEETNSYIEIPEIIFSFQRPTYLIDKDEIKNIYYCDEGREECKINLDLRDSFLGDFNENEYECNFDFGFFTGQENKCNPSSIIIPKGIHSFVIKINSKSNINNSKIKHLIIINNGYKKKNIIVEKKVNIKKDIIIDKPKIIIDSGVDEQGGCSNRNNCRINLRYITKNKDEKCLWGFEGGVYDSWNKRLCNPSYVKYGEGDFIIKLKVFERNNIDNFNESILELNNVFIKSNDKFSQNDDNIVKNSENNINKQILIHKIMPNPLGSDDFEYVELENKGEDDISLLGCKIDDIIDGGSKEFIFTMNDILKKGEIKKYYKEITKLNLNNDTDEVNIICDGKVVDKLKWNFKIKDGYYLNHDRLDIYSGKAIVLNVIDGDTVKIKFIKSGKIEKLRLIGIDSPETKHPNKNIELFGVEVQEYVKNELEGKEIIIEIDKDNFRDIYSRLLGYVYINNESFNEKMIKLGYAKAYLKYKFKYSDSYEKAEIIAKKDNLGIWASSSQFKILNNNLSEENMLYKDIDSIISIQGKIGKNKILKGNTITCMDNCSINFDGSNSKGKIEKYSWDFGNGVKYEGINPGYIKYENLGMYKVFLVTIGDKGGMDYSEFNVNFVKYIKKKKELTKKGDKYNENDQKKDNTENNESQNNKSIDDELENTNIFFYYILIGIIGLFLIIVLLWKEKLI